MEKSNNVWMKWKSYPALPRVILVPLTYLLSNMFHQWQLENIWSQSSTTFNCSKPNLIDSPENSYLLKASSIRSWFFRLLNFLWFHPRFHLFPQREFENVITRDQLVLHTHASRKKIECWTLSTFLFCNSLLNNKLPPLVTINNKICLFNNLSSTIFYILSVIWSTTRLLAVCVNL